MNLRRAGRALFVAAIALSLAACGRGPTDVSKQFVSAVADGNTQTAVQMMDPSAFQILPQSKMEAALADMTNKIQARGGVKSIETVSEKVTGDRAKVTLKVTLKNGSTDMENFDLVKRKDGWKIAVDTSK